MTKEEIEEEGMYAFMAGKSATDCPYSFNRSEFWEAKDYAGFERVRWKLDAWMRGWLEAQRDGRKAMESRRQS